MSYLHSLYVSLLISSVVMGMDHYSQEELVQARFCWLGQENRISQLKFEAATIASSKKCDYVNGNHFVGTIDANNNTITTFITQENKQKSIVLSYELFTQFINDKELHRAAIKLVPTTLSEPSDATQLSWYKCTTF